MTRRALAARGAARGRGHLMTIEAASHARQLVARRELELVDVAVTLRTLDVALEMDRVVELEIRFG